MDMTTALSTLKPLFQHLLGAITVQLKMHTSSQNKLDIDNNNNNNIILSNWRRYFSKCLEDVFKSRCLLVQFKQTNKKR